jgi:cob(I)alamin adenosyltransferase
MSRERDEPVRITRVYTRGGDAGETSLGDGSRVPKTHPLIAAYGTVDELNAVLGLARASDVSERLRPVLERVQNELFDVGADLCVPLRPETAGRLRVTAEQVAALEQDIDRVNADLPDLRSFVLPGGSETAALLHLARTVCRRAERAALAAAATEPVNEIALTYLNRLSDLLFVCARAANEGDEPLWLPGGGRPS